MKYVLAGAVVLWLLVAADVGIAKRTPPPQVNPVAHSGIEYRANRSLGYVEAWNVANNRQIWSRQIYVIWRNLILEDDVQDVYIKELKLDTDNNVLEVTNENGGVFHLDLITLEVKTVKGVFVIKMKT